MAIALRMPALSPSMEKGTLARWLVKEGDQVKAGDMIAEIETDKATMEFEAPEGGRISSLSVEEGTVDVAVGTVIAMLARKDEADAAPVTGEALLAAARPLQVPETRPARERIPAADRAKITPLARRIADANAIDLAHIAGTGPNGRIVRADLGCDLKIIPKGLASPEPLAAPLAAIIPLPPAGVPLETVNLSSMRRTIARRLSESKQTVPHFYLTARCNLDALLKLRGELNFSLAARGSKLSVNDMLMKAMALALIEVPDANVQFGGEALYRFSRVDISMAVAIDGGLITPIIRDVASLSLSAISRESKALAAKARAGKLVPEDYQGGTASISNLGMFGIDEMFPVINLPQALILGIGAGVEQPWKVDGQIRLATIMAATASFDHRAIDGATAAQFMAALREVIENPPLIM